MRQYDLYGERGYGFSEVEGDAGHAGAGDSEGTGAKGGPWGEGEKREAIDWVSTGFISLELAFERPSRVGPGRGAATGC